MKIVDLCTREVIGIVAHSSVQDAALLMEKEHVGALVVVTNDDPCRVMGVVTDRDLALDVLGKGMDSGALRVAELVKAPPLAVSSSAALQDGVAAMEKGGVRRLLVVDDDGGVVGLVAAEDLMGAISAELATLSRALHSNIEREKSRRQPPARPAGKRLVFPAFGTAAQ